MRRITLIPVCLMAAAFLAANVGARAQAANPAVDAIFSDLSKPGSPGCALGVYRGGRQSHLCQRLRVR